MARRPITPLVVLCREIGLDHLQATELFRRINREVMSGNDVITQEVGTFYRRDSRARVRRLNGIDYQVPERSTVALRGPRFPGRESRVELRVLTTSFEFAESPTLFTRTTIPNSGSLFQDNEPFDFGFQDVDGSLSVEILNVTEEGDSGASEVTARLSWDIPPLFARRFANFGIAVPEQFIIRNIRGQSTQGQPTTHDNNLPGSQEVTFVNVLNGISFGWRLSHAGGNGEFVVGNLSLRFERFLV